MGGVGWGVCICISHARTHAYARKAHTYTRARKHTHTHTHTQSHNQSRSLCLSVCVCVCVSVSLSLSIRTSSAGGGLEQAGNRPARTPAGRRRKRSPRMALSAARGGCNIVISKRIPCYPLIRSYSADAVDHFDVGTHDHCSSAEARRIGSD
jgi:hypothetical protein